MDISTRYFTIHADFQGTRVTADCNFEPHLPDIGRGKNYAMKKLILSNIRNPLYAAPEERTTAEEFLKHEAEGLDKIYSWSFDWRSSSDDSTAYIYENIFESEFLDVKVMSFLTVQGGKKQYRFWLLELKVTAQTHPAEMERIHDLIHEYFPDLGIAPEKTIGIFRSPVPFIERYAELFCPGDYAWKCAPGEILSKYYSSEYNRTSCNKMIRNSIRKNLKALDDPDWTASLPPEDRVWDYGFTISKFRGGLNDPTYSYITNTFHIMCGYHLHEIEGRPYFLMISGNVIFVIFVSTKTFEERTDQTLLAERLSKYMQHIRNNPFVRNIDVVSIVWAPTAHKEKLTPYSDWLYAYGNYYLGKQINDILYNKHIVPRPCNIDDFLKYDRDLAAEAELPPEPYENCIWHGTLSDFADADTDQWRTISRYFTAYGEESGITGESLFRMKEVFHDVLRENKEVLGSAELILGYDMDGTPCPCPILLREGSAAVIRFSEHLEKKSLETDQFELYDTGKNLLRNRVSYTEGFETTGISYAENSRGIPLNTTLDEYCGIEKLTMKLTNTPAMLARALTESMGERCKMDDGRITEWIEAETVADHRPIVECFKRVCEAIPEDDPIRFDDPVHIRTAVKDICAQIDEAKRQKQFKVIFLTGIAGSGKTYVGLEMLYRYCGRMETGSDRLLKDSVYFSCNEYLIDVIQDALKSHDYVCSPEEVLSDRSGNLPHVAIFDEAQRSLTKKEMQENGNGTHSLIVELLKHFQKGNDWGVILALIGNEQDLRNGDKGRLEDWLREMDYYNNLVKAPGFASWRVVCPIKMRDFFQGNYTIQDSNGNQSERTSRLSVGTLDSLELNLFMRDEDTSDYHDFIDCLLSDSTTDACKAWSAVTRKKIYLFSSLDEAESKAKELAAEADREREKKQEKKRNKLTKKLTKLKKRKIKRNTYAADIAEIESSLKSLDQHVESSYGLLRSSVPLSGDMNDDIRFSTRTGPRTKSYGGPLISNWYRNRGRESSNRLKRFVTEDEIQGLELDFPIIRWQNDYTWEDGPEPKWKLNYHNTYYRDSREIYVPNIYKVLLTRSRKALIICVPIDSDPGLMSTYDHLAAIMKK